MRGFSPTATIVRSSINRDYAYHNNTNGNPRVEEVPGVPGSTFLRVNYATTTTTFFVMTERPANAVPGEGLAVQMRIDYDNPELGFNPQFLNMNFDRNLELDAAAGHGRRAVHQCLDDFLRPLHQDDDGQDDGQEVLVAGTSPTNAMSFFRVDSTGQAGSALVLQWFARSNRFYSVDCLEGGPVNDPPFITLVTNLSVDTDQVVSTNLPAGTTQRLYRLRVNR